MLRITLIGIITSLFSLPVRSDIPETAEPSPIVPIADFITDYSSLIWIVIGVVVAIVFVLIKKSEQKLSE